MNNSVTSQSVFERFLRGELSEADALDALVAVVVAAKSSTDGGAVLRITRPPGSQLSATDYVRAERLMSKLDRRLSGE